MYIFLALSFLSGMVELGSVFLGVHLGYPLPQILMLPFFYQIGNLLISMLPKRMSSGILIASSAMVLVFFYYCHPNFWFLAIQLCCSSYCIQLTRMRHKSVCPTWLKRLFRIGGFALSPIMIFGSGQIIILFSLLLCFVLMVTEMKEQKAESKQELKGKQKSKGISSVMVLHQMHYFVYTYIMPLYIYKLTDNLFLSALAFSITWVVYLTPQTITERFSAPNYKRIFFYCHLFLGVCMGVIAIAAFFHKTTVVLLAWLLTGVGGGSVFCISHLCKKYESIHMDLSENIGHFLGPLLSVALSYIARDYALTCLSAASFVFVFMALLIAFYRIRKEAHL